VHHHHKWSAVVEVVQWPVAEAPRVRPSPFPQAKADQIAKARLLRRRVDRGFIGAPDGKAEFFGSFVTGDFLDCLRTKCPDTLPTPARQVFGVNDAPNTEFTFDSLRAFDDGVVLRKYRRKL
jgi:hypothetical protein